MLCPSTSEIGFSLVDGTAYLNIAPSLRPLPDITISSRPTILRNALIAASAAGNMSALTLDNPFIFMVLSSSSERILPYMLVNSFLPTT